MAAELGFAPLLANDIIMLTLEMCQGELPLIFSLPVEQVLSLGPRLIQEGAQAISISAPRGALPSPPAPLQNVQAPTGRGELITGRLYGPRFFLKLSKRFIPQRSWDYLSSARRGVE